MDTQIQHDNVLSAGGPDMGLVMLTDAGRITADRKRDHGTRCAAAWAVRVNGELVNHVYQWNPGEWYIIGAGNRGCLDFRRAVLVAAGV